MPRSKFTIPWTVYTIEYKLHDTIPYCAIQYHFILAPFLPRHQIALPTACRPPWHWRLILSSLGLLDCDLPERCHHKEDCWQHNVFSRPDIIIQPAWHHQTARHHDLAWNNHKEDPWQHYARPEIIMYEFESQSWIKMVNGQLHWFHCVPSESHCANGPGWPHQP